MARVRGLGPDDYNPVTGQPYSWVTRNPPRNWKRDPSLDKRIRRGDDFAGDAWKHVETGDVRYTVVNYVPSGEGWE